MKSIISSFLAIAALSTSATTVMASDYSEEVRDLKISVSALEKQLESMDVNYNSVEIESGLNRSQEVKALEEKYSSLRNEYVKSLKTNYINLKGKYHEKNYIIITSYRCFIYSYYFCFSK